MKSTSYYRASLECAADLLSRGEVVRFVARGGSMRPWIQPGDVLAFQQKLTGPQVGDVAWFANEDWDCTHRVVALQANGRIQTRGDSLQTPDPWWQASEYLGTLSGIRRGDEERPAPHGKVHLRILAFVRVLRHINWTRKRVFNQ